MTLSGVAITGSGALDGGGLSNEIGATATVTDSTLSGNSGTTGGAIYNGGTLTLNDSTVAGNVASLSGGGIANFGALTVISSTIALNSVSSSGTGGGIETSGGTTGLYDTIVAQNTAQGQSGSGATYSNIDGTVAPASSFNVIGSAGSGGLTNSNSNLIISDVNAGLGTLANNGGPTQTIALSSTSPALGAGSTAITGVTVPTADQRGGTRPSTTIDVGAYQSGATIPSISFKPYATYGMPLTLPKVELVSVTPRPVVVTTTVATPVTVTPPVAKAVHKAKTKVKLKVVTKKTHPGGGSSTKFHKTTSTKAVKHVVLAKAHAAAHAKKK